MDHELVPNRTWFIDESAVGKARTFDEITAIFIACAAYLLDAGYKRESVREGNIYYADGRSGVTKLGKHSLAVKTEDEALENLRLLDEKMARNAGLIPDEPKS